MKLYNTLTRKKEEFVPLEEGKVKMYVCGPTVYDYIHIGNARPYVIFDTIRRYMEYKGYEVKYVQNFTDVDDKIINKAIKEGVESTVISERYIAEAKKDAEGLNVEPATYNPKVTEEMPEIIEMIKTLIEKGHAYCIGYNSSCGVPPFMVDFSAIIPYNKNVLNYLSMGLLRLPPLGSISL